MKAWRRSSWLTLTRVVDAVSPTAADEEDLRASIPVEFLDLLPSSSCYVFCFCVLFEPSVRAVFVIEIAIVVLSGSELCNQIRLDPELSAAGVSLRRVSLKRVDNDSNE